MATPLCFRSGPMIVMFLSVTPSIGIAPPVKSPIGLEAERPEKMRGREREREGGGWGGGGGAGRGGETRR